MVMQPNDNIQAPSASASEAFFSSFLWSALTACFRQSALLNQLVDCVPRASSGHGLQRGRSGRQGTWTDMHRTKFSEAHTMHGRATSRWDQLAADVHSQWDWCALGGRTHDLSQCLVDGAVDWAPLLFAVSTTRALRMALRAYYRSEEGREEPRPYLPAIKKYASKGEYPPLKRR
ncbi:hypothetical protein PG996_006000 [Apiospora saccharicola]|uniref:Uncharacterized protein n=1 Tax=Apiospora saccharicola TaxID=335842 RepID=A0ABR1VP65_9PEZI